MKRGFFLGGLLAAIHCAASAEAPVLVSLEKDGLLTWTCDFTNGVALIESSMKIGEGWTPYFYDLATNYIPITLYSSGAGYFQTNYGGFQTSNIRTTQLPSPDGVDRFYRVVLWTNTPDPTLIIHLPFDNDFNLRAILDVSGHNNHALQYSATNWPVAAEGPDGSRAAWFSGRRPLEGSEFTQGDYAGIPYSSTFDNLTNGSVLAWAFYDTNSYHNSAIIDASAYGTESATWYLGRGYSASTRFAIGVGNGQNAEYRAVVFPDSAPASGATGKWNHYAVTWDGTNIVGYFNGSAFSTNSQAGFPALVVGRSRWLAVGCKVHQGTAQWADKDIFPNWGWIGGGIDDVRVYNRPLTSAEVLSAFNGMR